METKKLIVAGGREFNNYTLLKEVLDQYIEDHKNNFTIEIVSGMARGADALAYTYAKENNIICHEFPADWNKHGRAAGFVRNQQMGAFADGLLAFWDGKSKGTQHMISLMTKNNKPVETVRYLEYV